MQEGTGRLKLLRGLAWRVFFGILPETSTIKVPSTITTPISTLVAYMSCIPTRVAPGLGVDDHGATTRI